MNQTILLHQVGISHYFILIPELLSQLEPFPVFMMNNLLMMGKEMNVICSDNNTGDKVKNKNELHATYSFIIFIICSTCFGHFYAHHQELTTIVLITTWAVRFCKDA